MEVLQSQQLKNYTSMQIGGPATYIITVHSEEDVVAAVAFAQKKGLKLITLGTGTNVIFKDAGFSGVVIVNEILGFTISQNGLVQIGAGENWDSIIGKTIDAGFWGIEALSLVPGTAGATPVNNVGAYGQEISDTLVSVRVFDIKINKFIELLKNDCQLTYRNSRFKSADHGRFIITSLSLQLKQITADYQAPSYPSLAIKLAEFGDNPTPQQVRTAVIAIRSSKLPNPLVTPNTGSFFKNPLVPKHIAEKLKAKHPDLPMYEHGKDYKLAAGWLVEQAGLKNYRANGVWVYDKQALVLVNESAASFEELQTTYEHVQRTVDKMFGVKLEIEPELL